MAIYILRLKIELPTITATSGTNIPYQNQNITPSKTTAETYNETIHLTELHENDLHKKIEEEQKK